MPNNDNSTPHVVLEEDRAGNVRPVLAPLPEPNWGAWTKAERDRFAHVTGRYPCVLIDMPGAAARRKRAA